MKTLDELMKELYQEQTQIAESIRKEILKETEELGLSVIIRTKEEYDDNNYFTMAYIEQVNEKETSVHWDYGIIDDEFGGVVNALNEIKIPNTVSFMEGDTAKNKVAVIRNMIETEQLEFNCDISNEIANFCLDMMAEGKDINRIQALLSHYLDNYELFT